MTPKRAVLYCRISASDDASTAVERQEVDLRAHAAAEGWEVVDVLIDDGLSGGKVRAKAQSALAMLASGEVDVLAVWKFDRWSRQGLRSVADLIDALETNKSGLFVTLKDGGLDSNSPTWTIIAGVLAGVAKMERDNTAMRVRSSLHTLRTSGRYAGGQRPYGLVSAPNPEGPGRVLVIEPDEARVLREAADRVLAGASTYTIAHDFNARGITARNGGPWSPSVLRDTLVGHSIVGRVKNRGQIVRDSEGNPAEVWPPIIPVETWRRVRAALDARGGTWPQRKHEARLLTGVVTCGQCASPMTLQVQPYRRRPVNEDGTPNLIYTYTCGAKGHGKKCPGVSISAPYLETYVEARLLDSLGDLDLVERIESAAADPYDLAEVARDIDETTDAMKLPGADLTALVTTLNLLHQRRDFLAARPAEIEVTLVPTGQTFADRWEAADLGERRSLVAANVAILAVRKGVRGRKTFDSSRVDIVAHPTHISGVHAAATYRPGGAVIS